MYYNMAVISSAFTWEWNVQQENKALENDLLKSKHVVLKVHVICCGGDGEEISVI
jgi:hypothetical protein